MVPEIMAGIERTAEGAPVQVIPAMSRRISFEEFMERADEDTWAEWVDGEAVLMPPVTSEHQNLLGFLACLLSTFAEEHGMGKVFLSGYMMKTGPQLPGRLPDILFVAKEHRDRLQPDHLDGAADLVVEIISPESRARDRGDKFYEYEGGVAEYWLLDPSRRQAEFYQLDPNGIYQLVPAGADGSYRSRVLDGLWLRVAWLWQQPLPPLLDVLRQWELI